MSTAPRRTWPLIVRAAAAGSKVRLVYPLTPQQIHEELTFALDRDTSDAMTPEQLWSWDRPEVDPE